MSDSKKILLYDKHGMYDVSHIKKTNVEIREVMDDTGETVFKHKTPNKILLPGSVYTASKHFDIPIFNTLPTYNKALNLENSIHNNHENPGVVEKVFLFGVGTDGCGPDQHQVFEVNPNMWCKPEDIVPFRVVSVDNDIPLSLRDTYFGRAKIMNDTKIAYFFKNFDAVPTWNQRYVSDGTPIGDDVYTSHRNDEIESYIELKLSVTKEECREWFGVNNLEQHAKVNTLFLLIASYTEIGGIRYYHDIRPMSKVNFPNEPLVHLNKGLDILYQLFY